MNNPTTPAGRIYTRIALVFLPVVFAGFLTPAAALSQEPAARARPKIGLALSGGGARGAAHIGVLQVLEENRIPVDYVAGTSMGALVGGLFASGMSPGDIQDIVTHLDWADAFEDKIPRGDRSFHRKRDDDLYLIENRPGLSRDGLKFPLGLLDGQKIDLLLKKHTLPVVTVRDFDRLSTPYRAVAADIATGEAVIMGGGDLALAMRASMSIPVVFTPREVGGKLLVDGGVASNLPIDVVRSMGADVVIAVDISTPMAPREEINSVLAVTDQLTSILTRRNTDEQIETLSGGDVFIEPDLGDITTASFDRAVEAVPIGRAAAEAVLDELSRLSVSPAEYDKHQAGRRWAAVELVVDEVRVVNLSGLSDDVITSRIHVPAGEPLDVGRLERDIGQIYGLELFESVYYDVTTEAGRNILTVTARENSWGPDYLQFGVAVLEDYEGPNFNVAAAYTRTAVNGWGGEWRTGFQIGQEPGVFTEFFQPVGTALRNFVHAKALFEDRTLGVFGADRTKLAELGFKRYLAELAAGRELGAWGELRAGVRTGSGKTEVLVGDPGMPEMEFSTGEVFAQFYVDELDDLHFPRAGGSLLFRVTDGVKDIGSGDDYEQGLAEGTYAHTVGSYTSVVRGLFAVTRDSDAPVQNLFRLGGFGRLSGLEQNELSGQHAALLSGAFYKRVVGNNLVSLYAGLTVEYGNVFQTRDDISPDDGISAGSVFVGADTILGPVHVAYGRADGGRWNYYVSLGQSLGLHRAAFWTR